MIEIRTTRTSPAAESREHSLVEAVVGQTRISLDYFKPMTRPIQVFTDGNAQSAYFKDELVAALQDFSDRVSKAQQEDADRLLYREPEELCVIQESDGEVWGTMLDCGSGRTAWRHRDIEDQFIVFPTVAAALHEVEAIRARCGVTMRVVRIADLPPVAPQFVVMCRRADGSQFRSSFGSFPTVEEAAGAIVTAVKSVNDAAYFIRHV